MAIKDLFRFNKREDITPAVSDVLLQAILGSDAVDVSKVMNIPAIAQAVHLISETVSMIQVKLYSEEFIDGKKTVEVTVDNAAPKNLSRVSLLNDDTKDTLDGVQFKRALVRDYLLYGSGTLEIPVYDTDADADSPTGDVAVAYQGNEFTELVAGQGKFTSAKLKGYSHGALSVISRKLLNNVDIDVTSFIENKLAQAFAEFWEKELLVGTGSSNSHMTGAISTTNLVANGAVHKRDIKGQTNLEVR